MSLSRKKVKCRSSSCFLRFFFSIWFVVYACNFFLDQLNSSSFPLWHQFDDNDHSQLQFKRSRMFFTLVEATCFKLIRACLVSIIQLYYNSSSHLISGKLDKRWLTKSSIQNQQMNLARAITDSLASFQAWFMKRTICIFTCLKLWRGLLMLN